MTKLYSCTLTPRKAYTTIDNVKWLMHRAITDLEEAYGDLNEDWVGRTRILIERWDGKSVLSIVPQRGYGRFMCKHEELEEEAYPLEVT